MRIHFIRYLDAQYYLVHHRPGQFELAPLTLRMLKQAML